MLLNRVRFFFAIIGSAILSSPSIIWKINSLDNGRKQTETIVSVRCYEYTANGFIYNHHPTIRWITLDKITFANNERTVGVILLLRTVVKYLFSTTITENLNRVSGEKRTDNAPGLFVAFLAFFYTTLNGRFL